MPDCLAKELEMSSTMSLINFFGFLGSTIYVKLILLKLCVNLTKNSNGTSHNHIISPPLSYTPNISPFPHHTLMSPLCLLSLSYMPHTYITSSIYSHTHTPLAPTTCMSCAC